MELSDAMPPPVDPLALVTARKQWREQEAGAQEQRLEAPRLARRIQLWPLCNLRDCQLYVCARACVCGSNIHEETHMF